MQCEIKGMYQLHHSLNFIINIFVGLSVCCQDENRQISRGIWATCKHNNPLKPSKN